MAEENDVLQHLLHTEAEAAALVNGAQAEADRRAAESEKAARALHDEQYGKEAAALEADYTRKLAAVREDYRRQVDACREELAAAPVDYGKFAALAKRLLLGEG
ncbi:MAG: hypothetical protein MdMp014T_2482 [Treponematales bacterium]